MVPDFLSLLSRVAGAICQIVQETSGAQTQTCRKRTAKPRFGEKNPQQNNVCLLLDVCVGGRRYVYCLRNKVVKSQLAGYLACISICIFAVDGHKTQEKVIENLIAEKSNKVFGLQRLIY